MPIDDARVGFAQVVAHVPPNAPYVAVFARAYRRDDVPPPDTIVHDDIAFLAHTLDALVHNGTWTVVGSVAPDTSRVAFPHFKEFDGKGRCMIVDYHGKRVREATAAEEELLGFRTTVAPIRLQAALQARHGAGEWREHYRGIQAEHVLRQAAVRP